MLRGDRSRLYTIGLALTLLLAGGSGWWIYSDAIKLERSHQLEAQEQTERYTKAANIAAERRCTPLPVQAQPECVEEERKAAREAERNEGDLEAQRTMAVWTRTMGIAAIIAMIVGMFGVGLIFITFRETRSAARATERMAFDTPLAVAAAVEANNEMREGNQIARAANRPIMVFDGFDISSFGPEVQPSDSVEQTFETQIVMVTAKWKNIGPMPALPVACEMRRSYVADRNPTGDDIVALNAAAPAQQGHDTKVVPSQGTLFGPPVSLVGHRMSLYVREGRLPQVAGFALVIAKLRYKAAIGASEVWETEQVMPISPRVGVDGRIQLDDFLTGPPHRLTMS